MRIADLNIHVNAFTKKANAALAGTNTQLKATQGTARRSTAAFDAIGKAAQLGAAAAAVGIGYAVKKAADFEQQLSSLESVSGANEKQMKALRDQAMKAGAATKFSALDAAQAQTELAKAGLTVSQIAGGGLKASLALAAAGEMDLAAAAGTTATALNLFGLGGKSSIKVANALAAAANATKADVSDFAQALNQSGSVAKSAGLSFDQTMLALTALGKIGIESSDAGTSLRTALIQLVKPTEKQAALTKELGLNFLTSGGSLKSMAAISEMLRGKLGNQTAAQRTATLATLAGTDGVRTLTALFDAGPAKLDRWEKALTKGGTAAQVAAKKQDNFKGKLEALQGQVETLTIGFGSKLLPELSRAAEILADPKIGAEGKFNRLADMLSRAVEFAIPKIADAAAKAAPKAVSAFVHAWMSSGIWGRLIIGGFLLKKMGGLAAFAGLGTRAGTAAGVAAGTSWGAAMTARAVAAAPGIVAALHAILGPEMDKIWNGAPGTDDLLDFGKVDFGDTTNVSKDFKILRDDVVKGKMSLSELRAELARFNKEEMPPTMRRQLVKTLGDVQHLGRGVGRLANTFDKFGVNNSQVAQLVDRNLKLISRTMGFNSRSGANEVRKNMRAALRAIDDNLDRGRISAEDAFKAIRRTAIVNSKAVKGTTGRNFRDAANAIRDAIRDGQISSETGLAMIRKLWRAQLRLYGYSPGQVTTIMKAKKDREKNTSTWHVSPDYRQQTGGIIPVTGTGSGDKVRALLEPGEVVVNRKAVAAMGGPDRVHRLNQMVPRFQGGGIVGLGRQLQQQGYQVGEHPAFGGVAPVHSTNSYHYKGMAIDVNADTFSGGEGPALDKLYARLRNMPGVVELLWRVADHFDHLHVAMSGGGGALGAMGATIPKLDRLMVGGPDSAVKSLTQGALDSVLAAANDTLSKLPIGMEGAELGMGGIPAAGAMSSGAVMDVWQQGGGPASVASTMDGFAFRESRRIPTARGGPNTDGTYDHGLWQINDIHRGRFGALFNRWAEPLANAKMAVGLYNTAGLSPWDSSAMQLGGIVEELQGGGMAGMSKAKGKGKGKGVVAPIPTHGYEQPYGTPAGQFGRSLDEAIGLVRKAPTRKNRAKARRALRKPLNTIAGLGLSPKRLKTIQDLSIDYDKFSEWGGFASQLDMTDEAGNTFPGVFRKQNEAFYVGKQLETLRTLRNRLLEAEQVVSKEQLRAFELMKRAEKRLAKVKGQIADAAERKRKKENQLDTVGEQLKTLRKKPKVNKAKIEAAEERAEGLKGKIGDIEKNQRVRVRVREALGGEKGVVTQLKAKQSKLGELKGSLLGDGGDSGWHGLRAVQGVGGPPEILSSLPTMPGGFGGFILDAQVALRDLGAKVNIGTEPASDTDSGDSERAGLLEQLLREANQRTAVSESQFAILKDFRMSADGMPFAGMFAKGGQIPAGMWGIAGERGPEPVMGPATVVSNRDAQSMLAGVGATPAGASHTVMVNVHEGGTGADVYIDEKRVEAIVNRMGRKTAAKANRAATGWGQV